jgi:hypothetical protein
MANCSDNIYVINYTDESKGSIVIPKGALIQDELDIALIGKNRKEYGQFFNEHMLHILENFACPEDGLNPGNPDLSVAYNELLERPVLGQIWYNSTQNRPFVCTQNTPSIVWKAIGTLDDVAGNFGRIFHGEQIPRPVSLTTGYVFEYSECSWVVSPCIVSAGAEIDFIDCRTDANGVVTMQYSIDGSASLLPAQAFYQIIGIRDC